MMFEGLTEIAPDGSVAPALATSWTISPDGLTYTFKLDPNARFHNGRNMNSADVKFSLERIKDPATKHPNRSAYDVIARVDSPDPATSIVTLSSPYAPLLAILGDVYSSIVPQEEVAKGNFGTQPVGTGPFRFAGDVPNQSLTLDAFKDYRMAGRPLLDRIQINVSPDQNAAVLALQAGQFDMLYDAPGENIDPMRRDTGLVVYGGTGQQTFSWLMLNDKPQGVPQVPAFSDVRARQALFSALDRTTIANLALPGLTDPLLGGFLPPGHWAALSTPVYPTPDLPKARQLLADAGYANGFEFTLRAVSAITHFPRAAQIVQQQLQPLGIKVNIEIDPPGANNFMQTGQFQAYFHGTGATVDPDQQFQQSFMPGGGRNYTNFQDDEVAALVKQAQVTTAQADRAKLYQQAQTRLANVGPMAFVYTYNKYDVAQKYVMGYTYNPILVWRQMRDVWLDK